MRVSWDIFIWSFLGIALTFIAINVIRWMILKSERMYVPSTTLDQMEEKSDDLRRTERLFKRINVFAVGIWVIVVCSLLLFHTFSSDREYRTVESKDYETVKSIEVTTDKEIEELNKEVIEKQEEDRARRVSAEKDKAKEEYEKFLNKSIKKE